MLCNKITREETISLSNPENVTKFCQSSWLTTLKVVFVRTDGGYVIKFPLCVKYQL